MTENIINLIEGRNKVLLTIRVVPKAKNDEITEIMSDGTIKIRLGAQPVDGRANEALIKYLSKILGIPHLNIEIAAGFSSRKKLISIKDLDSKTIQTRILQHIE